MIKCFSFEETFREDMTLDQGVRLNPKANRLELMPVGGPLGSSYPTDVGTFYARTRVTLPESLKKWTGFFVLLENKKDFSNTVVTDVRYKLNDGTQDFYWNGGANAWVLAAANNWNTEAEVADNIEAFPSRSLQVVVMLQTSDPTQTPNVTEVRLSYDSDLEFLEDYVVRSFIEDLREQVRPIGRVESASDGSTLTIDLTEIETPYDIVGLDSVYDGTADPNHLSDLGASFDSVTKVVTLPAAIPSGNTIHVRFLWRPEVVISKSQEYTEIARIPVIIFEGNSIINRRMVRHRPYIVDKSTGEGFAFENGFQADIPIPFAFITDKGFDSHSLAGELKRYFANNRRLRSRGQDEYFSYRVDEAFDGDTTPTQKELHTGRLLVTVLRAVFYPEDAKPITGVKRFTVSGGNLSFEQVAD